MLRKKGSFIIFFLTLLLLPDVGLSGAIKKWEVFEIELTAKKKYKNPYVDGLPDGGKPLLQINFSGISGEAKGQLFQVTGFWDGGQIWKVRFAPPFSGKWIFTSISADPGLTGKKGSFECEEWTEKEKEDNPVRRGFIQVNHSIQREGRYFVHYDGTPFLWIGDTWWGWNKRGIHFSSFRNLVDNRAGKGFTIGQLFVPGNGWRKEDSCLDSTFNFADIEHIKKIDEMIRYANLKGITVWVHGWWAREGLDKRAGREKVMRWQKYLIHRFGAYNVIWTLCGEYTLYNFSGFGLEFWNELGRMVETEDPYDRIISIHPNPSIYIFPDSTYTPYYSTAPLVHNESWLNYNQIQVGHSKWRNEMIPVVVSDNYALSPHKPVVVTEPWYEFIEGNYSGNPQQQLHGNIVEDIIFGGWSAILSGAAGHSYGGGHIWMAHLPETPARGGGTWPLDTSFNINTLDYPGARSIGIMATFLKKTRWWELEPHPELVSDYPEKFCIAVPGREYLVYVKYGGGFQLNLSPSAPEDKFEYTWLDPRTGETDSGIIKGGNFHNFVAPGNLPGNRFMWKPIAWILYLRKL